MFTEPISIYNFSSHYLLICIGYQLEYGAWYWNYRKFANIRLTQSQNINVSCLVLQLSLPNPLKSGVELRMKMQLDQHQQAML